MNFLTTANNEQMNIPLTFTIYTIFMILHCITIKREQIDNLADNHLVLYLIKYRFQICSKFKNSKLK